MTIKVFANRLKVFVPMMCVAINVLITREGVVSFVEQEIL